MPIIPLSHQFQEQFVEFSLLIKKVSKKAHGKDVHALRSLTRRMRADLWMLEQTTDMKIPGEIKKGLRHMTHRLGESRQLHVLYKDAQSFHLQARQLKQDRNQARKKLRDLIDSKWQKKLFSKMQNFHERLLSQSPVIDQKQLKRMLNVEIKKLDEQTLPHSQTKWHARRIKMRKLQYRLEVLGMHSASLKDLQRSIGRAHDLHILFSYYPDDQRIKKEENKALRYAKGKYHANLKTLTKTLKQKK